MRRPLTALTLVAQTLVAQTFAFASPAPARDSSASRVLFEDQFDEQSLDRKKWNVEGPDFWVNNEQQAYIDSPETVSLLPAGAVPGAEDGVLALRPQWHEGFKAPDGRSVDFVSSRINTRGKFDFTHGTASARIKMPDAAGVWPAFWLLGYGDWPNGGEIDVMEYVGEKDWTGVAMHGPGYSGETPLVNKFTFDPGTDVTDWHVYSVDWSSKAIVFSIDGRPTYKVTRAMVENYGEWKFDGPQYVILNFALGGAYPFKTNGVKTPYNGLPAETVDSIRRGDVAMYVDWVRVEGAARD